MKFDKTSPVAGVVIKNDKGQLLLVQEKWRDVSGLWNLPAGIQDKGETLQETAVREAKEETGYIVRITNADPLVVKVSDRSGRTLNSFAAEITSGELKINSNELLDAKWLTLDEIKKLDAEGKLRDTWVIKSASALK